MHSRSRLPALLLISCYGLLVFVWVFTNPAGAAPDEWAHYVRALAVGRNELRGRPNPQLAAGALDEPLPKTVAPERLSAAWAAKGARVVRVPGGLGPHPGFGCSKFDPNRTAACLKESRADPAPSDRLTPMGTVEPAPYVLPGLATRFARGPVDGLLLARAANGLVVAVLLGAAVAVLWSWAPAALSGLVVGVTPMVVFVGSALGGSAVEVGAAVCFFACLLTVAAGPSPARRAEWACLAAGGVVLASSRSLGPVWIAIGVAAVVASAGVRATWATVRSGGWWAGGALAAISAAIGLTVVWEAALQPGVDFDFAWFLHELGPSGAELPKLGREMIGVFGWLDTEMPAWAYMSWTVLFTALIVSALLVGSRRQRTVLVVLVPAVIAVGLLISAGLMRQNGFDVQGRHVLALATLVPLFAGAVIAANQARFGSLWPRGSLLWFAAPMLALQGLGWYTNAKRYAVGANGPAGFIGSSAWRPPGGWWFWVVVVAVALVAGLSGAALACRASRLVAAAGAPAEEPSEP